LIQRYFHLSLLARDFNPKRNDERLSAAQERRVARLLYRLVPALDKL